ncbi:MAG: ribonuclease HI [Spirochaetaceae bacterium]|jgi:ribonuclease HI|nr:ribonuclease HI [Spirochaetaceae bacterium]
MGLLIYTDGGCSGNPGPGGWAYIIIQGGSAKETKETVVAEQWGAEQDTTNNRMELQAVIAALEALIHLDESYGFVTVYTDSQYVQKGISMWIHQWKKKNWKTSDNKPVKNVDLWQRLDELSSTFLLSWEWVKGHAGNRFNERCDRMTQEAIASLSVPSFESRGALRKKEQNGQYIPGELF